MASVIIPTDIYGERSFLRQVPIKNFYLDVSKLPVINYTKGDYVIVPSECENRIDLFSYQQFGTSRLWWVIALANADMIKDPIWDFKSGMEVFIPRDSTLLEKLAGVR
jgi:hypothetical protein